MSETIKRTGRRARRREERARGVVHLSPRQVRVVEPRRPFRRKLNRAVLGAAWLTKDRRSLAKLDAAMRANGYHRNG